jgi:hypothetical protein
MITMSLREGFSLLVFLLLLLVLYGSEMLLVIDYVWGRICRRPGKSERSARRYLILHLAAAVEILSATAISSRRNGSMSTGDPPHAEAPERPLSRRAVTDLPAMEHPEEKMVQSSTI